MNDTFLTITGWVGSEVTLTVLPAGQQVATFRVGSTPRRLVNGAWQDGSTSWFTVKAWRQLGANVAESVRLGEPVMVHGRLVADVWERPDGQTTVRHILVATAVGHDLARGTSRFTKPAREAVESPESSPSEQPAA